MVKGTRSYVSARRATQAAETRGAIVAAARAAFIAGGWQGTTMAGVARAAGVSPETVYAVFGSKAALLRAVIERAVRRAAPATPLAAQAGPRAVAAAPDQRLALALFAQDIAQILAGAAKLMAVARTAAETDAALRETYHGLQRGRRETLALVVAALRRHGELRAGMSDAEALASIWRLASPELFVLMTEVEGMSPAQYGDWLAATLTRLLLAGG